MASFPDLRPHACLAKAECGAALSFRRLVFLPTACAVTPTIAFNAVSELATLRGQKAFDASTFLTRALRAFSSLAFLVRKSACNGSSA
jgi:hypothetical protein